MHNKTLKMLRTALIKKDISSVELTQHFLKRIASSPLNSFITICDDSALASAKAADERIASGNATPLTGIPFAHKDIFCTKGIKTSCASKMLDNFIPPYDATVTHKLNQAGAVMLGKTNMDEFAMGSSNENSHYGAVKNPWALDHTPGGSSGGSAACVAARLSPVATGTDTGGSIRQPAAFCGITGIKPTYGRVSRYGMIAFASSLDQGGVFANTAEDAAIFLNTMCGHDPKDSTSAKKSVPDFTKHLTKPLTGLKIGLPKEYFTDDLDPIIGAAIEAAKTQLTQAGATLVDIELPHTDTALSAYYVIAPAECSANLSRFDGVRYGHRADNPTSIDDLYLRSRTEGFGDEVKRRIMIGTYVLSAAYYDAYYLKAQKIRRLIKEDFTSAFETVDLILAPTSPTPSFQLGKHTDPVSMYLNDIYTIPTSLAGLPALSLPIGFKDMLPLGMQLIAPHFEEGRLLNAAHQFQLNTNWHTQTPTGDNT